MLLSLMSLVDMFGGLTPVTPHGGGENIEFELVGNNLKKEDEYLKSKKLLIEQEEEDIFILVSEWVISQNSN